MRYYSDELKQFFDSESECISAEEAHKRHCQEKDERKTEVDIAFNNLIKLIEEYNKDYNEAYTYESDDFFDIPKTIYAHIFG